MINLIDFYLVTKMPALARTVPRALKGKARFNTCYDYPRPSFPIEMVNEYINSKGDRAKNYLKNNLPDKKYLRVEIFDVPMGTRNTFSLIDELPRDHEVLSRTGYVKFIHTKDVEIR